MINIPDIFNVGTARPIDSRMVKPTLAERDAIPTNLLYDGLECFVEENFKKYRYYLGVWHEDFDISKMAFDAIPKGIIAFWSGLEKDIPAGWHLCDGTEGTLDLRDRFIVSSGSKYRVGDKGGSDEITLSENQIPYHKHTIHESNYSYYNSVKTNSNEGGHSHTASLSMNSITGATSSQSSVKSGGGYNLTSPANYTPSGSVLISGEGKHQHNYAHYVPSHNHGVTMDYAGGSRPFDNRPKFYALAFIQKITGSTGNPEETLEIEKAINELKKKIVEYKAGDNIEISPQGVIRVSEEVTDTIAKSHTQNTDSKITKGLQKVEVTDTAILLGHYPDTSVANAAVICGNGTADNPHNAWWSDWNGNIHFSGDVEDGTGNILSKKATLTDLIVDGKVLVYSSVQNGLISLTTEELRNLLMWVGTEAELDALPDSEIVEGRIYSTFDGTIKRR